MSEPDEFLPAPTPSLRLRELAADVPAALRVAAVVALVGALLGALWAAIAPRVNTIMLAGGASGSLPGETDHAFDAVAVFVLLVIGFGVVAAAIAWRRRADRGPVMLLGVVAAALVGAWLAGRVGALLAPASTPVPVLVDRAAISASGTPGTIPGTLVGAPASPGPWWIAVAAGVAAALTYVIAAIADGHEDPRHG